MISEISDLKKSNEQLQTECLMWKSKFEASVSDCQKEKKVCLSSFFLSFFPTRIMIILIVFQVAPW